MKRIYCLLAILALLTLTACAPTAPSGPITTQPPEATGTLAASSQSPTPPPATTIEPTRLAPTPGPAAATPEAPAWDDRSIYRAGLVEGEQEVLARLPDASVYHIDLHIAADMTHITGSQQVRYTNAENEKLEEVYLRLFPNATGGKMTVADVAVDGREAAAATEYAGTALRVSLPAPLLPGDSAVISLNYVISVPVTLDVGYGVLSYVDNVLALDSPYAAIPVYDDEGWNVEIPPNNADLSYFDASFYRVHVTAPAGLTLVASGVEIAREQAGADQSVTFAVGPARDFYLAASADYELISVPAGATRVNSYAPRQWAAAARAAAETAAASLEHYGARFGPYPYTEMDVVSTPLLALGIEYPGITGITLRLYDPSNAVGGLPSQVMIESTVAHEMAHQWFYNLVGNDQVDEPWLDEALAQYATALYFQDSYGEGAANQYRASWASRWERVERAEKSIGLPAGEYVGGEYSAIVYGRGPFFLQALADRMGAEVFDRFMAAYAATYRWGIAGRADFEALAEATCGCSLDDLFAAWVDR